jgi:uncharacterized damage-inducible protein DinB
MLPPILQQLVRHMEWADALVWRAVLAHPAAHADARTHERLHHVHMVQWAYLGIWRGERPDLPKAEAFPDLPSLHAWGRRFYPEADRYFETLAEAALSDRVDFPWAARLAARFGEVHPVTLGEAVLQLASHSTYHRGQINARLREISGEPPLTDFIAWIWQGRPAPDWTDTPGQGPPPVPREADQPDGAPGRVLDLPGTKR